MSLYERNLIACRQIITAAAKDDEGGFVSGSAYGQSFKAAMAVKSTAEAVIADKKQYRVCCEVLVPMHETAPFLHAGDCFETAAPFRTCRIITEPVLFHPSSVPCCFSFDAETYIAGDEGTPEAAV